MFTAMWAAATGSFREIAMDWELPEGEISSSPFSHPRRTRTRCVWDEHPPRSPPVLRPRHPRARKEPRRRTRSRFGRRP